METVFRPDDIRYLNRKRVLSVIRRERVASRKEIAKQSGLSAATVSAITSDFIEEGVLSLDGGTQSSVEKTGANGPGRGRPKIDLTINATAATVCAVYFQLNRITATLFDFGGDIVSSGTVKIVTRDITAEEIRSALIACIETAIDNCEASSTNLRSITTGFQGVTDVKGKIVLWTPICDQHNLPIKSWLESHFGVSAQVANDCDMITRALNWREPELYGENFATVLLAHGVGMGLFLRGEIMNGTHSSGVEFGHMTYTPNGARCRCGNNGCIEAYAGDYAISRNANGICENLEPADVLEMTDLNPIAAAIEKGDEKALEAVRKAGAAIGTGLASLFAIIDAFPVVFVGPGATFLKHMEPTIRAALATAPGANKGQYLDFKSFPNEGPLVQEGCAITALLSHDDELSSNRRLSEAAE